MATDRERGAEVARLVLFLERRGEVKDIRGLIAAEAKANPAGFDDWYAGLDAALTEGDK